MKHIFIIAILLGVCTPLFSQWNDDFSDNEFISNPAWLGNTSNFIVDGEILRLNAPSVTGSSYLSTVSDISLEAAWNFYVKLDFNPSSSNYIKVYLMSDSVDLEKTQQGYFIKIGGSSDKISLYKVSEASESLLIDGTGGRVNLTTVEIFVRITRDKNGDWNLMTKLLSETDFVSEGEANDLKVQESTYFGVFCKYTSTRSTKFYVDDISVTGNPFVDQIPPVLESYSTPQKNQIKLVFDEPLESSEALKPNHYSLNGSFSPTTVTSINANTVLLDFTTDLELANTLEITSLPDLAGNQLDTIVQVHFVDPAPYNYRDLVINELFADPNPQEDLPAFEFLELFNNSDRIIDVEGWQFTDGSKVAILEQQLLFPDSFLIICPLDAAAQYHQFGLTMGLATWPTLNNGGDSLTLSDKTGVLIDSLSYAIDWYKDSSKDDGGWSLEQINPRSICLGVFNWVASNSLVGGTPGKINSVNDVDDVEPPYITQALATGTLLEVWFSEPVASNIYTISISSQGINSVISIGSPSNYGSTELSELLETDKIYSIYIPLIDCNRNIAIESSILKPIVSPVEGDLVINEILFNPYSNGSDFVEIVNTTPTYFNLQHYTIANETKSHKISDTTLVLAPYNYFAISEDMLFLKNQYLAPDSSLFEADLPTMPNDDGVVVLKSNVGSTIDSVFYSDDYHVSLIADTEGISLERISMTESSGNKDNWRSAAETVGFATPGYENSQSKTASFEGAITVSPKILTPNNDGQADFCQISFELDQQSQTISTWVYNINGQLVHTVAHNALIGPSGFFTWDGTDQQGGVLPTAHYIIVSEVITSDGRTLVFKNKVVVANGF